jgi:hypothetical protein
MTDVNRCVGQSLLALYGELTEGDGPGHAEALPSERASGDPEAWVVSAAYPPASAQPDLR